MRPNDRPRRVGAGLRYRKRASISSEPDCSIRAAFDTQTVFKSMNESTLTELLEREPKTLHQAREQLAAIRERLATNARAGQEEKKPAGSIPELSAEQRRKEHAERERVIAEIRGSNLPEATPGEKILMVNGRNVVCRDGCDVEVAALEDTRKFRELDAALKAETNSIQRFRIAADMGELRRTYGTGKK